MKVDGAGKGLVEAGSTVAEGVQSRASTPREEGVL